MDDRPSPEGSASRSAACVDCGRPVYRGSTRCRACYGLTQMRRETAIPGCPFPPGHPGKRRTLTAAERRWIRTAGADYTARHLAQHFGVHPRTIARIRAEPDAAEDAPGAGPPPSANRRPRGA